MKKDKGISIIMNCKICGLPISQSSTDFGMECENECERKQWEQDNNRPFVIDDEVDNFFNSNMSVFAGMFDAFEGQNNLGGQMLEHGDDKSIVNELKKNFKK